VARPELGTAAQPARAGAIAVAVVLAACGSTTAAPSAPSSTASSAAPSTTAATRATTVGGLPTGPPPQVAAQAPIGPAGASTVAAGAYGVWETMTSTKYQHHDVESVPAGTYYFDCVGWTTFLLEHAATTAAASLRQQTRVTDPHRVPSPTRYAQFMSGLAAHPTAGWQAIANVADIRAGDLLAWYPESNNPDEAGHAVVAAGPVQRQSDGTYALVVIDSTGTPHGPDDTRRTDRRDLPLADGRPSGLGVGTIGLVADPATGAPTSVLWSLGTTPVHKAIGMGRPTG
jgi:hypothetical protein